MATARTLPDVVQWLIPIEADGTVPDADQYMQIGSLDSIEFENGAAFTVQIEFTGEFSAITLLTGQSSGPQGGSTALNTTINFTVYDASTTPATKTGGPYAVQFGTGPLLISISNLNTNPDPIAIPAGGEIQFDCVDGPHNVTWTFANKTPANGVWSPQPATLSKGVNVPPQVAQAGATGQTLLYSFPTNIGTRGGGTVNMGS